MKLSDEQIRGFDSYKEGKNLFITGDAGTGKSTLVHYLINSSNCNVAVLAPTGIAALNIGGSTIHRYFKFPLGILEPDKEVRDLQFKETVIEKIQVTDVFIIDEISMVRADMFETIDSVLREVGDPRQPFGGKQMIVVGDFQQLSPVVTDKEKGPLSKRFKSPYSFDTTSWKEANFTNVYLTKSFRQNGDRTFLKNLNLIKKGNDYGIDIFNEQCIRKFNDNAITLSTTNKIAANINRENLNKLESEEHTFQAFITGKVNASEYPNDREISMKEGCRVLCITNDPRDRYCNGDLGTVTRIVPGKAVIVQLDNGADVALEYYTWEICDYTVSGGKLEKTVIGEFVQLPVKLGYAVTIHKSQGKTLQNVNIELGYNGCFCHGQLYVALSRATTLDGINLRNKIKTTDLIIDRKVKLFYKELQ